MKRQLVNLIPLFVAIFIALLLFLLLFGGAFKQRKETLITSSTLTDAIDLSELSTAEYIQNGVAKALIEGRSDHYFIFYKAVVKTNVDFSQISFEIDHTLKTVKPVLPLEFTYDVSLDEEHGFKFHPKGSDLGIEEVYKICKEDAKAKAKDSSELQLYARESLLNTIVALVTPILDANGYTIVFD